MPFKKLEDIPELQEFIVIRNKHKKAVDAMMAANKEAGAYTNKLATRLSRGTTTGNDIIDYLFRYVGDTNWPTDYINGLITLKATLEENRGGLLVVTYQREIEWDWEHAPVYENLQGRVGLIPLEGELISLNRDNWELVYKQKMQKFAETEIDGESIIALGKIADETAIQKYHEWFIGEAAARQLEALGLQKPDGCPAYDTSNKDIIKQKSFDKLVPR